MNDSVKTTIEYEDLSPEMQVHFLKAQAQYAEAELERKRYNNRLLLVNFPIRVLLISAMAYVGLITIRNPASEVQTWVDTVVVSAIVALLFMVIKKIANFFYVSFIFITCCLGALTMPIYYLVVGYITLYGIQFVIPEWFSLPDNMLLALLVGFVISFGQVPELSQPSKPEINVSG